MQAASARAGPRPAGASCPSCSANASGGVSVATDAVLAPAVSGPGTGRTGLPQIGDRAPIYTCQGQSASTAWPKWLHGSGGQHLSLVSPLEGFGHSPVVVGNKCSHLVDQLLDGGE